ncbi:MAG TPA: zinc ribbon domain-containing protein [Verrucomicrobiota bacterium]|nr:zinc ribbon domain-containing protein [Verrucomicrobiota bacterium]
MPIYEFACPKCRVIFNFFSKRINPDGLPTCPRCGNKKMVKMMSRFSTPRGIKEPSSTGEPDDDSPMPDFNDPRIERAMQELERDIEHIDENNPRHLAYMMKKMKAIMPPGTLPPEMDVAIKRLEAGEDPEKIEEDMGDVFDKYLGGDISGNDYGSYSHDSGLYDY